MKQKKGSWLGSVFGGRRGGGGCKETEPFKMNSLDFGFNFLDFKSKVFMSRLSKQIWEAISGSKGS